ncbi:TetR/AcrR family transcriptional regulator, partial [Tabrizicola sp.]|uniref:TetR/AcrR family transcriptional regulator n=1 Tax=Tabrizicola sp. TaxID=2005166 RepID=UPI003F325FFE
VAHRAFADRGFAEVSLDALAAEAGVTRGALHHHFTNKAGLFEAVLRQMDAEIGAELDAAWDSALPSWTAWRACFHQYLDAVLRPDRLRLFFLEGPAILGAQAFDLLLNSGLAEVVEGLSDPGVQMALTVADAEAMAITLNGAVLNLALWVAEAPDQPDRKARAHRMLDALFDGLTLAP